MGGTERVDQVDWVEWVEQVGPCWRWLIWLELLGDAGCGKQKGGVLEGPPPLIVNRVQRAQPD
jgi:hypothetical protein